MGALIGGAILIDIDLLNLFALSDIVEVDTAILTAATQKQVIHLREANTRAGFPIVGGEDILFA